MKKSMISLQDILLFGNSLVDIPPLTP